MDSPTPDPGPVQNGLLRRWLEDRAAGRERTVAAYQALYPGNEELVAAELARLAGARAAPSTSPGTAATEEAFRAAFDEDQRAGRDVSLAEYVERFPGAELSVAAAFAALVAGLGTEPRAAAAGTRIGPYRLVRELGRGGQGVVYLAEDPRLGRTVALKVLSGLAAGSPDGLRRFQREATLAARLDHPGICAVYEWDTAGGVPFVAMRFVPGSTLAERIDEARGGGGVEQVDVDRAIDWTAQAARALAAAHDRGVIHRDLKPSNLMISPGDEVVLLDFGLARSLDAAGPALTRTGDAFGTPAYMSPEQVGGERELDGRADVYSLGVCLYEALTLRRPFEAPTRTGLLREILRGALPDPRARNPRLSSDLAVVLRTALARDAEDRYPSAAAFAADLEAVRASRPISARPATLSMRLRRWARREPRLAAAAAGLLLALGLLAGSGGYLLAKAPALRVGEEELERTALQEFLGGKAGQSGDLLTFLQAHPGYTLGRVVGAVSMLAERRPADALPFLEGAPADAEEPVALERVRAAVLGLLGRAEEEAEITARLPEPSGPVDCFAAAYLLMVLEEKDVVAPRAMTLVARSVALAERPEVMYYALYAESANYAGEREVAARAVAALERFWPDYFLSQLQIAQFRLAGYDYAGARAAFERTLELKPDEPLAHAALSLLLHEAGEHEAASAHYERAWALSTMFPDAVCYLHLAEGEMLLRAELYDDAVLVLDRALQLQPELAKAHRLLGQTLVEMGEDEWGREELERALELDPLDEVAREALARATPERAADGATESP